MRKINKTAARKLSSKPKVEFDGADHKDKFQVKHIDTKVYLLALGSEEMIEIIPG